MVAFTCTWRLVITSSGKEGSFGPPPYPLFSLRSSPYEFEKVVALPMSSSPGNVKASTSPIFKPANVILRALPSLSRTLPTGELALFGTLLFPGAAGAGALEG